MDTTADTAVAPVADAAGQPSRGRGFYGLPLRLLLALAMTAVVSVIVLGVTELTASRVREARVEAERVHEIAANIAAIASLKGSR